MKIPGEFTPEDHLAAGFIEKMATSNTDGLRAIYGLYQRPLMGFILSIVHDLGGSEEILQDVFVRAYEQAQRYDPELGTPFVWLATIARRMSIDWLRKHHRRPRFVSNPAEQHGDFGDKELSDDSINVHEQIEAKLALEILGDLPPEQRQAVELAFVGGYTHQEISELLGKPLGTVKSDLRRGLIRLRKYYLGEDD